MKAVGSLLGADWFKQEVTHSVALIQSWIESLMKPSEEDEAVRLAEYIEAELRRIQGVFQFLKFPYYKVLGDELSWVIHDIFNEAHQNKNDLLEIFSYVLIKLPIFIEQWRLESKYSLHWVSCVNQLRLARHATLLSDKELLALGISSEKLGLLVLPPVRQIENLSSEKKQEILKKIRSLYQRALVAVFKEEHQEAGLIALSYSLNQLKKFMPYTQMYRAVIWGGVLIELIQHKLISLDAETKRILGWLGRQLEKTEIEQEAELISLQKKMIALFLSALAQNPVEKMSHIKLILKELLDVTILSRLMESISNYTFTEEKQSILLESLSEFQNIREQIEDYCKFNKRIIDGDPLLPLFLKVANVLEVSGFPQVAEIIVDQHQLLLTHSMDFLKGDFTALTDVAYHLMAVECFFQGLLGSFPGLHVHDVAEGNLFREALQGAILGAKKSVVICLNNEMKVIKERWFGCVTEEPLTLNASLVRMDASIEKQGQVSSTADDHHTYPYHLLMDLIGDFKKIAMVCRFAGFLKPMLLLDLCVEKLSSFKDSPVNGLSKSVEAILCDVFAGLEFYFAWHDISLEDSSCDFLLESATYSLTTIDSIPLLPSSDPKENTALVSAENVKHTMQPEVENSRVALTADQFIQESQRLLLDAGNYIKIWAKEGGKEYLLSAQSAYIDIKNNSILFDAQLITKLTRSVEEVLSVMLEIDGRSSAAFIMWMEKVKEKMKFFLEHLAQTSLVDDSVDALLVEANKLRIKLAKPAEDLSPLDDWVFDQNLLSIFYQETMMRLDSLEKLMQSGSVELVDQIALIGEFHGIQESSHLVGAISLSEIASAAVNFLKQSAKKHHAPRADMGDWVLDFTRQIRGALQKRSGDQVLLVPGKDNLLKSIRSVASHYFEKSHLEAIFSPIIKNENQDKLLALFSLPSLTILVKASEHLKIFHFKGASDEVVDSILDALMMVSDYSKSLYLPSLMELCDVLIGYYDRLKQGPFTDHNLYQYVQDAQNQLVIALDQLASGQILYPLEACVAQLTTALNGYSNPLFLEDELSIDNACWDDEEQKLTVYDKELVDIFLDEAHDLISTALSSLQRWIVMPHELLLAEELYRDLHTLKGGARLVGIKPTELLAYQLENLYEGICDNRVKLSEELLDLLMDAHEQLNEQTKTLKENYTCAGQKELYVKLQDIIEHMSPRSMRQDYIAYLELQDASRLPTFNAVQHSAIEDSLDEDVLYVFLDEAKDLIEQLENHIQSWIANPSEVHHRAELQRLLHTLKGGARLTDLTVLGNVSHEFEQFLVESEQLSPEHDETFFKQLDNWKKQLLTTLHETDELIYKEKTTAKEKPSVPKRADLEVSAESLQEISSGIDQPWVAGQKDTLRVPAELLDKLVNLSAESSLTRGRIEQEVHDFYQVTHEMEYSLLRVKDLLKRLELEAESRTASYGQKMPFKYAEFDPMEMDRYSNLHHIFKALMESSLDLTNLKDSLIEKYHSTETLLVHQARVDTEIQDKLLQSRMVPFSRLLPRLRKLVNQVSIELNKKVNFEFVGVEDKLDRTLLERMLVPLEHMLRNAIDHGIETPEERIALGKAEYGRVTLLLAREGTEVVLRLSDDGRGIDVDQVKTIAIEKGLIESTEQLSDHDILQFIFKSGFSTRSQVTQISGRGVGMDIVYSEIKQVGGAMKIHSAPNVGTQFSIRLPFTVSLYRALMVRVGEDSYAVPMSHVESIIRLPASQLMEVHQTPSAKIMHGDKPYQLKYLGWYVHGKLPSVGDDLMKSLPVLLVRGGDYPIALQVDSVIGSREVVVQSVGPQLSSVSGISGATILGDGSVVIILDVISLLRAERAGNKIHAVQMLPAMNPVIQSSATPMVKKLAEIKVLVVDDSVTVRRVIHRSLARQGMQVTLTKDGMEAMVALHDQRPDVILVDIEMPRMDGLELIDWIQHEEVLRDIPVIMITSRVGDKHRQRAEALGIKYYLGKPFQDDVLLETIHSALGISIQS